MLFEHQEILIGFREQMDSQAVAVPLDNQWTPDIGNVGGFSKIVVRARNPMSKLIGQGSAASMREKFVERFRRAGGFHRDCAVEVDRDEAALTAIRAGFHRRYFDKRR